MGKRVITFLSGSGLTDGSSFQHNPDAIREAFLVGDNKPSSWCLSFKDQLTVTSQVKDQAENDFTDFVVKDRDELKNLIEEARKLGGKDGLSMWPFFVNRAYFYVDVEQAGDMSEINDTCAQAADREACMRGEAPKDLRAEGEAAAVHFLTSTTGQKCEIFGGYEQDNTDVVNILMQANDQVSDAGMTLCPSLALTPTSGADHSPWS